MNDFEVHVYNIQRPSKENVPLDNSYDYYMRVVLARKVAAKKAASIQKAPTLANFIQSIISAEVVTKPDRQKPDEKIPYLTVEQVETMKKNL